MLRRFLLLRLRLFLLVFLISELCFPCHLSLVSFEDKFKRYFRRWSHNRLCEIPTHSVFCNLTGTVRILYACVLTGTPE